MNDRVPTYPGRVKLTPVAGLENTYQMEMADEPTQSGDPPTKVNLLPDAVAALWGGSSASKVADILKYAAARYGTCVTAAATAAKVVTLSNFVLSVGAVIGVNFSSQNTASSPTLNVNGTGAKTIYFNGAVVGPSQLPLTAYFQYDGTYWQLINGSIIQSTVITRTGTGTYGTPISVVAPFPIKFVAIRPLRGSGTYKNALFMSFPMPNGDSLNYWSESYYGTGVATSYYASSDGKTLYWWSSTVNAECNISGITYEVLLVGWN